MKGLVRPHQSSRFAPHTVTVTKSSNSMKLGGGCLVAHEVMPALLRSAATSAPRGCGVVSASWESSTKKSTSRAKRSNVAQQRVVIARALAIHSGSIIVEDRPVVADSAHLLAIEDGALSELHSPMDRSSRQSHVRHQPFLCGELWSPYASPERNGWCRPMPTFVTRTPFAFGKFEPTNVQGSALGETSLDFHDNSNRFIRRFMTTNPSVRISRKASKE